MKVGAYNLCLPLVPNGLSHAPGASGLAALVTCSVFVSGSQADTWGGGEVLVNAEAPAAREWAMMWVGLQLEFADLLLIMVKDFQAT